MCDKVDINTVETDYPYCIVYDAKTTIIPPQISVFLNQGNNTYKNRIDAHCDIKGKWIVNYNPKTYPQFIDYRYATLHALVIAYKNTWKEFDTEEEFLKEYGWLLFIS